MDSLTGGAEVQVRGVEHSYDGSPALQGVDLDIRAAEFVTLLGPSGSGKSTLLQVIAGLIEPACGQILIGGTDVSHLAPERRDIGFVFQNYALFPHMTVHGNVAFPLQMRRHDKKTVRSRVADALDLVGLSHLAGRYPGQLSGGQQQRVALARAITFRPRVLLLDEPLGALDRQLRQQLGLDLRRLQRDIGITTIYVTHDQEEAFVLSSRIAVMNQGRILQVGAPRQMYRRPTNLFVANFLGDLNVLDGLVNGTGVDVGGVVIRTAPGPAAGLTPGSPVSVGIRPEELRVSADALVSADSFGARVEAAIFGGSWVRYELILANDARIHAVAGKDRR
jgi:ABC-type Fe3+/spermidine/putrescine transport system ATPase subunit